MQIQTVPSSVTPSPSYSVAAGPAPRVCHVLELGSVHEARVLPLPWGRRIIIGRGPTSDVQIDDPALAERHACVEWGEAGLLVRDLNSPTGLFVDGCRVPEIALSPERGHFFIGHTSVTVRAAGTDDDAPRALIAGLVGTSRPMRRLVEDIVRYAKLSAPVLIQGESGTGKDVVARALHELSGRQGAFVPLNVGAIPESLADSELFGHARGAFTGAQQSRVGAFEEADGGTLLLDEIGDLAPSIQVKLLRVIEDGTIRLVGGTGTRQVKTRVVSATWADLHAKAGEGTFRADLYHRISTVVLRLPPLRERRGDLPQLAHHILTKFQSDLGPKRLSATALGALGGYGWPGNVRELGSVLYRAAISSHTSEIDEAHVLRALPASSQSKPRCLSPDAAQKLLDLEKGNISAAARVAGVPRSTFRGWLCRDEEGPEFESSGL